MRHVGCCIQGTTEMRMTRAASTGLALLIMTVLPACAVDGSDGGADTPADDGGGGGAPGELAGEIGESGTLSGTVRITASATILPGVQIAVAPGSEIVAAEGVSLTVRGALLVDGSADQPISIIPDQGVNGWIGVVAESGGAVTIRHAIGTRVATLLNCRSGALTCALDQIEFEEVGQVISAGATATLSRARVVDMANAAVFVKDGGDLTVSDSELMTSTGDIVVASGGRLLVEYSTIGGTVDTYEHCNIHVGKADALTIRYSNIVTAAFGIMIGGVDGAVVQNNNFEGNGPGGDVDPIGLVTAADFTNNFWDGGPPLGLDGEFQVAPAAEARIAQAGPRP